MTDLPGGVTKLDLAVGDQMLTGAEIAAAAVEKAPPIIFQRAVVVEVLYDLASYSEDELDELKVLVGDNSKKQNADKDQKNLDFDFTELLLACPRNSLLVRPITAGADKRAVRVRTNAGTEEVKCQICYPFFPSHLAMPVKPGETVWVVNDSPEGANRFSYWMCRITAPEHVEDANYTHMDRMHGPYLLPKKGSKAGDPKLIDQVYQEAIFGFPNGDFPEATTLSGFSDFEYIVNESGAYNYAFTPDTVPRFTKRPGDLVLQGSNNTLISLGEDRGWTKPGSSAHRKDSSGAKFSNATKDDFEIGNSFKNRGGTIDIVAGRGRYAPPFYGKVGGDAGSNREKFKSNTAAETLENTPPEKGRSSYVETNKNPAGQAYLEDLGQKENVNSNPTEGDPDLYTDASRIYVSMATSVDRNFSIDLPGKNMPTAFESIPVSEDVSIKKGRLPASIIAKSDQIRLIARRMKKDEPAEGSYEIKGSIRLIKEGDPKDDLSALLMLEDGNVQLSGKKIFIGRTGDDGMIFSDYGGKGPGLGDSQPYVRFSDLQKLFVDLWNLMDKYSDVMLTAVSPGGGAQSPQIVKAATDLKAGLASIKASASSGADFNKLASERIFGE